MKLLKKKILTEKDKKLIQSIENKLSLLIDKEKELSKKKFFIEQIKPPTGAFTEPDPWIIEEAVESRNLEVKTYKKSYNELIKFHKTILKLLKKRKKEKIKNILSLEIKDFIDGIKNLKNNLNSFLKDINNKRNKHLKSLSSEEKKIVEKTVIQQYKGLKEETEEKINFLDYLMNESKNLIALLKGL